MEALTQRLVAAASTLKLGAVTEGEDVEIGPLISERHLHMVADMVSRAKAEGGAVALGGERSARAGFFFPPTVITQVARGSEITRQ